MKGYDLPTRQLASQDDAAIIEKANIPRSKFSGSWTRKTAFNAGDLVPIMVEEVMPGDHLRYNVTAYVRMATPLFPLFDNQRIDTFFFFVPCRILWENWERFMGSQDTPASSINFTVPYIQTGQEVVGSIFDHMGLPVAGQITPGENIRSNAMPFRAYNKIWNDWFRDQNIQDKLVEDISNGPDVTAYALQKRAKAHDYFTTALPWPQKFTAPSIPLSGTAPILGLGKADQTQGGAAAVTAYETGGGSALYTLAAQLWDPAATDQTYMEMTGPDGSGNYYPAVYADLSQASGVAINTLRQAWLVQSLLERDARGGTRYVETIRAQYGVTPPDFRLQRPEYIGGGSTPLNITPIAQTAPTTGVPLGALGAAGTAAGSHVASYAATEHGYIIGLINVRTELSYQQGRRRLWARQTRYDFPYPILAGLGEQAVYRDEIYCTGVDADDGTVFGYQERYHEMRTHYSEVTGIMRSTAAGTIDAWHLSQKFTAPPTLSATFIKDDPPMTRVLAAGSSANGQQYLADILYNAVMVRPLPMFGTPVSLGRF